MINQEHNSTPVYHKERKGAILGFNLIQIVMSPRSVSILSCCPSHRSVGFTTKRTLCRRWNNNETILKQWQCTLNARKSTVHNSSLVRKLREMTGESLPSPFSMFMFRVFVGARLIEWCKILQHAKTKLLDVACFATWNDTHIDSPHLTRLSTLSLLTILSMGNCSCSVVKSPFDAASLSTAG